MYKDQSEEGWQTFIQMVLEYPQFKKVIKKKNFDPYFKQYENTQSNETDLNDLNTNLKS